MTDHGLFRQIARAVSLGDDDAGELIAQIPDDEEHEYHTYITAVFAGFAGKYFEDDSSHAAIRRFVNEMRHDYRTANPPLKALTLEGLLRAFYGEEHLMAEIDPMEQLRCEFLAMRKMVFQSEHLKQHLDEYLADAEALALRFSDSENISDHECVTRSGEGSLIRQGPGEIRVRDKGCMCRAHIQCRN